MPEFPNTPFQAWLEKHGACEEGRTAVGSQTLAEWWASTDRTDWMLWIVERDRHLSARRTQLVRLAVAFARRALRFVPAGEDRPRLCVETVERWLEGKATIEEVRAARDGAYAAHDAAHDAGAYGAYAAYAAADAVLRWRCAAGSVNVAAATARAAAADYAAERRAQCDIIRAEIAYTHINDLTGREY